MCLFTLTLLLYILVNIFAGAGRKMDHPIELGNIQIPKQRSLSFSNHSKLKQKILDGWTSKTPQDWKPNEKVNLKNSRIAISCLLEGKRIEEINNYLNAQDLMVFLNSHQNPELVFYEVGRDVNNPSNNFIELLNPA